MPVGIAWPSIAAVSVEYAVIGGVFAAAVWSAHPAVVAAAFVVIATRQHALFILYHDAVHGLFARSLRANDAIVNATVGVPLLVPVHVYRALHLTHHAHLGTARDPERVLLYRGQSWAYRPLAFVPLARQLLGDLLLVNNVRMLVDYVRLRGELELPDTRVWPETWTMLAGWLVALGVLGWAAPTALGWVLLLWFLPFVTLTQAIQKVRSFAEHDHPDAAERSYSWRPGLLARLVVWPYHIGYHREHHERPTLPWYELPGTASIDGRAGSSLVALMWSGRFW